MRAAVADMIPDDSANRDAAQIAETFVAVCIGYSQQMAVRGDLDPAPFTKALMAILRGHGSQ